MVVHWKKSFKGSKKLFYTTKSTSQKTILTIVSMVVHRKDKQKKNMTYKTFFIQKKIVTKIYSEDRINGSRQKGNEKIKLEN